MYGKAAVRNRTAEKRCEGGRRRRETGRRHGTDRMRETDGGRFSVSGKGIRFPKAMPPEKSGGAALNSGD